MGPDDMPVGVLVRPEQELVFPENQENVVGGRLTFEDDDLDWVIGELGHATDEAKACGSLLYKFDPELTQAALDFFRRYHLRIDANQEKFDFDSIRISDEERERQWYVKLRRLTGGLLLGHPEDMARLRNEIEESRRAKARREASDRKTGRPECVR